MFSVGYIATLSVDSGAQVASWCCMLTAFAPASYTISLVPRPYPGPAREGSAWARD